MDKIVTVDKQQHGQQQGRGFDQAWYNDDYDDEEEQEEVDEQAGDE